ncbi:hypothetical protein [Sandaracinus amylolyticus]|uniref:Uncharacterized protein n=1 Tax=Sandaracinus amylolyticus TaxID=927083 RepID=A0A0F6YF72_9BACT|nr:hypothetical protein [Sandaracinus amylolyticus]AKF03303.1 hypothetical protein DB32_000452 [Sandaracinus amylolyticus]
MNARSSGLVIVVIAAITLALFARDHDASAQSLDRARITPARVRAALARYRDEPSVDALVRAVLDAPALDPRRARDAADRARLAGLLPQTRADVRRGQTLDLSALQSTTGERSVWSSDDSLSFSGSVTFQLDRLLFAREETSLMRELRHLEERRLEIATQVVHLYFERRRLQLERDLAGTTDVAIELRIIEAEALLDVFTSGAFSRMMAESITRGATPAEDAFEEEGEADEDVITEGG